MQISHSAPHLGFGLGLRPQHYPAIFEKYHAVDWFEIISENFMDTDGRPKRNLARIKELYPVVMHGVALSIGTVDPLNSEYLAKLKTLADWLEPKWISDHLCWTGVAHRNTHDLLPIPYTEEALKHVTTRIREVQDFLEKPIALENPSTYLEFKSSEMPEAEFIARMAEDSGCNLLLDVNNLYVNCYNHGLDPVAYIDAIPLDRVTQIHLSGHSNYGTHIVDTHDDHVADEVWSLYAYVVALAGRVPNTMIEWDDRIPEFDVLLSELTKAKHTASNANPDSPLPNLVKSHLPYEVHEKSELEFQQKQMQNAIFTGDNAQNGPADWIKDQQNFSASDRLAVYTNAYRARLIDATAEDYPALKSYPGEKSFKHLLASFTETARSEHFNIGRYSAKLPQYISAQSDFDLFAYEIATLEAAISEIGDLPETVRLIPEHLAGFNPELLINLILHRRAALRLFAFSYAVNDYYNAFRQERTAASPEKRATYLAIFRDDDTVWRLDLVANEYALLKQLFSGVPVGEALGSLRDGHDISIEELTLWFARWMRNGLLAHRPHDPLFGLTGERSLESAPCF